MSSKNSKPQIEKRQQQALELINQKLDNIRKEFAKCKQIADEHGVLFRTEMPSLRDGGEGYTYYPTTHKDADGPNWKAGHWISSSQECN